MTAYPNTMNPGDAAVQDFLASKPEIGAASFVVVINEDGEAFGFAADPEKPFHQVAASQAVPEHWKEIQSDDVSWTVYEGSRHCRNRIGGSSWEC